jgi:catechol 2,3-dioxygenase-like lactoylglutathione lyase family enzyme
MTDASEEVGDLRLATVVVNVQDMNRAVDFWTAALGYVRRDQGARG